MKVLDHKIFTEKDLKKLIKFTNRQAQLNESHLVTSFLFQLMSLTGLRISEALNLKWNDVREGFLILRETKSNESQTVRYGKRTRELLALMNRKTPEEYLFTNSRNQKLGRTGAHRRLKSLLRASGLSTEYSLHSFRHYSATNYLNKGMSLAEVKKLMRHSNISTTSIYLHHSDSFLEKIEELM